MSVHPWVGWSVDPHFGQRPQRGRCPVEHRGTFVREFLRPPLASGLKSQPPGSNPSLQAQILFSRLKSQPWGSSSSLEAEISALRLKSQPQGSNPKLVTQRATSSHATSELSPTPQSHLCVPSRIRQHSREAEKNVC